MADGVLQILDRHKLLTGPRVNLGSISIKGLDRMNEAFVRRRLQLKPGEQFALRKKAFPLIKKAFDENGIEFAYPTVKIAEGEKDRNAVVQHVIARKPRSRKKSRNSN